jgi:nitroreductase/Pyruvate/2-oxoacid:ferredoxin oxidoreductase delta subunit
VFGIIFTILTNKFSKRGHCIMKQKVNPPVVITEDCIACQRCVAICPSFVMEIVEAKAAVVRGNWCIGCQHCGAVCPTAAIHHEGTVLDSHPSQGEAPATSPEVLELLLRERRSVRLYRGGPVPEEVLNKILNAGRYAPTGSNSQNVHYTALTTPDQIAELRKKTITFYDKMFSRIRGRFGMFIVSLVAGQKITEYLHESLPKMEYANELIRQGKDPLFHHAPAVILAHAESWDRSSSFNCSVALYNCSLMAHTLGLGCCFNDFLVNALNHSSSMKAWLAIPADHKCYSAMTLGFPDVRYLRLVRRAPAKVSQIAGDEVLK